MRILRIINSYDDGGVLTCEVQYIKELQKRNVVVDGIIIGEGKNKDFYKGIVNNYYLLPDLEGSFAGDLIILIKSIISIFRYSKKHASRLSELSVNDYSAIVYQRPTYIFLAGILSTQINVPAFWHMAGTVNSHLSKRLYSIICRRYDIKPIANSANTKESIGEICEYVVYPGFDESRVIEGFPKYRVELNIPSHVPVYGMVARICYTKAQDLLVQAFVKSNVIQEGGHLIIAGPSKDKDFMSKIENIAGNLLGKQIHFVGKIDDLPNFYSSIDVAVNSVRVAEGFGISVAEALGASKPVIAYKLGGPSEMIENNYNGWLVNNPVVEDYVEIINVSLSKRQEWYKMGLRSKEKSVKFSVVTNVNSLLKIIDY